MLPGPGWATPWPGDMHIAWLLFTPYINCSTSAPRGGRLGVREVEIGLATFALLQNYEQNKFCIFMGFPLKDGQVNEF